MASEIVVIVPDIELKNSIEKLQPMFETKFDIYQGFLEEGAALVARLEKEGAKIVVSRGGTAELIRKQFPHLPLINIPITTYDAIHILYKAKQIPGKIAVVGFPASVAVTIEAAEFLDMEIMTYVISSLKDTAVKVEEAKAAGCTVIVGAKEAVRNAKALNICGIQIFSHEKTIFAALDEAEKVLSAMKNEIINSQKLDFILNSIDNGVAYVDNRGKVLHLNQKAIQVLNCRYRTLSEAVDFDQISGFGIKKSINENRNWVGEVKSIRNGKYAVSLENILIDGENIGAVITMQEIRDLQNLEQKVRRDLYQKGLVAQNRFEDIVWRSSVMEKTVAIAKKYAVSNATILIWGESGTGKEIFAQSLHNESLRRDGPFVAINCAALPENLIESELFGYVEGAFTGARKGGKAGLFELAHKGTLFLDEIAEVPIGMQARLLRALEEKKIRRIGDDKVIPVDVRIISATNRDLKEMIRENEFREDLYYRLNVLRLELPPLRRRIDDIPLLCSLFIQDINENNNMKISFDDSALEELKRYSYPGNIRELRNIIERLMVSSSYSLINSSMVRQLSELWQDSALGEDEENWNENGSVLEREEMKQIFKVLRQTEGNKAKAAQILGISKTTLWRKLKDFESK